MSEILDLETQYEKIVSIALKEINNFRKINDARFYSQFSEYAISIGLKGVAKAGIPLERFMKLTADSKNTLVDVCGTNRIEHLIKDYLRILDLNRKNEIAVLDNYAFYPDYVSKIEKFEEFYGFFSASSNFIELIRLELSRLYLSESAQNIVPHDGISLYLTTIFLLSKYYGESVVSEIISYSADENIVYSISDFESIIEKMRHMKDYPFPWILSIT